MLKIYGVGVSDAFLLRKHGKLWQKKVQESCTRLRLGWRGYAVPVVIHRLHGWNYRSFGEKKGRGVK